MLCCVDIFYLNFSKVTAVFGKYVLYLVPVENPLGVGIILH